jgi:hypothetical protein
MAFHDAGTSRPVASLLVFRRDLSAEALSFLTPSERRPHAIPPTVVSSWLSQITAKIILEFCQRTPPSSLLSLESYPLHFFGPQAKTLFF